MNQVSPYRKETVAITGFVILNLTVLLFGGWFSISRIIEGNTELKEKKASLAIIEQNWQEIKLGQDTLDRIKPGVAKTDQSFVSMRDPVQFIKFLENLAQKTNNLFEINQVTFSEETISEENILPFQIYLGGNFADLMHFLNYVENMEYYIKIESLQISQLGTQNIGKPQWKDLPSDSVYSIINLKAFTIDGN